MIRDIELTDDQGRLLPLRRDGITIGLGLRTLEATRRSVHAGRLAESFFGPWMWDSEQTVGLPSVQGVCVSPLRRPISQFE
jgi:hypothetical protein